MQRKEWRRGDEGSEHTEARGRPEGDGRVERAMYEIVRSPTLSLLCSDQRRAAIDQLYLPRDELWCCRYSICRSQPSGVSRVPNLTRGHFSTEINVDSPKFFTCVPYDTESRSQLAASYKLFAMAVRNRAARAYSTPFRHFTPLHSTSPALSHLLTLMTYVSIYSLPRTRTHSQVTTFATCAPSHLSILKVPLCLTQLTFSGRDSQCALDRYSYILVFIGYGQSRYKYFYSYS